MIDFQFGIRWRGETGTGRVNNAERGTGPRKSIYPKPANIRFDPK